MPPFSKFHTDALTRTEIFVFLQFDVTRQTIYSESRTKDAVAARFVCFYILNKIFHFPSTVIGDHFKRDHTSVLNGIKQVEAWEWGDEIRRQFYLQFPSTRKSVEKLGIAEKVTTA